jgi:hypothetical protein
VTGSRSDHPIALLGSRPELASILPFFSPSFSKDAQLLQRYLSRQHESLRGN